LRTVSGSTINPREALAERQGTDAQELLVAGSEVQPARGDSCLPGTPRSGLAVDDDDALGEHRSDEGKIRLAEVD
jgi:hypothetical protein